MLTEENCVRSMYTPIAGDSNEGCVGVLKMSALSSPYKQPKFQLFRILGGFGASPSKMGNAVFGHFCADGETCRMEKFDFIGIADEATTAIAEELEAQWKESN